MGDQALQSAGNIEASKATASFKQARSDKVVDPPMPTSEGLGGFKETIMGAVTGDQERQTDGNVAATKSLAKDGI